MSPRPAEEPIQPRHLETGGVIIKPHTTLTGALADQAWQLYTDCFTELNALAVQRHLMYREEFDVVMADERVTKMVTLDDAGELAGLSTLTRDLDAVPLVAPAYFERHYPELYATRRIWYIGFFAVAPAYRSSDAFRDVFAEYYQTVSAEDGLIFLDTCGHNETVVRLVRAIDITLKRMSGGVSRSHRVDSQSYWGFDVNGTNAVVFP